MLWLLYSKNLIDSPAIYRGMINAAEKSGMEYKFYFYEDFKIEIQNGQEKLFYEDEEITQLPKIALVRGRCIPLQDYFKKNNIRMINKYDTILLLRDLLCHNQKQCLVNFLMTKS